MSNTTSNAVNIDMPEKCNSCSEFEAATETVKYHANSEVYQTETVVRCQHKAICDRIEQRFKEASRPQGMPRFGS